VSVYCGAIGFEETYLLSFRTANQKGIAFVQILIISVTLIVVAVPEGMRQIFSDRITY